MKRTGLLLLILVFVMSSCGLAQNSDEENLDDLILEYQNLLMSAYETGEEETDDAKIEIVPKFWYREKSSTDSVSYDVQLSIEGDSALAEIYGRFPGVMNIYYVNDSLDTVVCEKDFIDTIVRFATFKKDTLKEVHGGWRIDKITGAKIYTESPAMMHIDSVWLYKTNIIDTVIRDIHSYFAKDDYITLPKGEIIEITIFSPDTTGFFFIHSLLKRSRFTYTNGVYTGNFRVPLTTGVHRVAFDGMTEETLLETDSCYSAYGWMLPYKSE